MEIIRTGGAEAANAQVLNTTETRAKEKALRRNMRVLQGETGLRERM
jgi:hypothetical protein